MTLVVPIPEGSGWETLDAREFVPPLPREWNRIRFACDGLALAFERGASAQRLVVIFSVAEHPTIGRWAHVSASYRDRVPSWATMCELRDLFIGDRVAVQVHPRRDDHVNQHPNCLHLWSRLDADAVPNLLVGGVL